MNMEVPIPKVFGKEGAPVQCDPYQPHGEARLRKTRARTVPDKQLCPRPAEGARTYSKDMVGWVSPVWLAAGLSWPLRFDQSARHTNID